MVKFIPIKKTVKTPELARLFIKCLYKLYGLLLADIVFDRDRMLDSHFWREVFQKLGTTLSMSTADHPQSDGQTKRVNQLYASSICKQKAIQLGGVLATFGVCL